MNNKELNTEQTILKQSSSEKDTEMRKWRLSSQKALCDLILATPKLRLQSVHAMQTYLKDDLRFDFSAVQNIDLDIIRQWIEVGRKKAELRLSLKFLETILLK
jgi:hypothetical protein